MCPRIPDFAGSYIVVADEDRTIANFVIDTLETDGHSVFWAYDGITAHPARALGLKVCDLVISNSRVGGQAGVDLIIDLRERLPWLSILYLANEGRSTPGSGATPAGRRAHPAGAIHWRRPALRRSSATAAGLTRPAVLLPEQHARAADRALEARPVGRASPQPQQADPEFLQHRDRIAELALEPERWVLHHLPAKPSRLLLEPVTQLGDLASSDGHGRVEASRAAP